MHRFGPRRVGTVAAEQYAKQQRALENATEEPDVLPVFFYNDMLVVRTGGTIRLRLFEPRYQEMCRRMLQRRNRRFLFMPNFDDYYCHLGDVGFVIQVRELSEHAKNTFGIGGEAVELAAVQATWIEPNTDELHYAAVRVLDASKTSLTLREFEALCKQMMQRGWQKEVNGHFPYQLMMRAPPEPERPSSIRVLFGVNWKMPQVAHLQLCTDDERRGMALLREVWMEAVRSLPCLQSTDSSVEIARRVVHMAPSLDCDGRVRFKDLVADLESMIKSDKVAAQSVFSLKTGDVEEISSDMWHRLLAQVRVAGICDSPVSLPTARLHVKHDKVDAADCLPYLRAQCEGTCVLVSNDANVHFYLPMDLLDVTATSALDSKASLSWRLNRMRILMMDRGRHTCSGPLALLKDDVMKLIWEFLVYQ